jgi:squalene-hopene/tetraprenyl-beta-curcumene cyclase
MLMTGAEHIEESLRRAREQLLGARVGRGHWVGELSASALATATAVVALALTDRARHARLIAGGLDWLQRHQNADGGWGDTPRSRSNISTTTLCWAALSPVVRAEPSGDDAVGDCVRRAESWLSRQAGGLAPAGLAGAIGARYGRDRTFSTPILLTVALTGRLGGGGSGWEWVKSLPFELAACPPRLWSWLRLPVVSYALPALIAVGQARHHHRPTRNPLVRWLRDATRDKTLRLLERIQPSSGGFLEAIPLTSFVTMSLASAGLRTHPVTRRGEEFLARAVRSDGSWPVDINLATWVTTLAVNALAAGSDFAVVMSGDKRRGVRDWLLAQQQRQPHSCTNTAPGGWAWTDLPGGVPDADDTAGALVALKNLEDGEAKQDGKTAAAAELGVRWLLDLQNADGGVPTFCRGWGALPFDRSGADLTGHALRAWAGWRTAMPGPVRRRMERATRNALRYLLEVQRADGGWAPLWFGNQAAPGEQNPVYGTANVVAALCALDARAHPAAESLLRRGAGWLLAAQNADGGWGGAPAVASSIEETALAVAALAKVAGLAGCGAAALRGARWLAAATDGGRVYEPSPIGFYFAKLWYHEALYPLIFTVAALSEVKRNVAGSGRDSVLS